MTLPKAVIVTSAVVLLLLLSLAVTLPYWLPSVISFTPFASSVQMKSVGWKKPTQLHVEQLTYQQESVDITARDINLSWTEVMVFSLSAMKIDVEHLQVEYKQTTSEGSAKEESPVRLIVSERLPELTITNLVVVYEQVTIPVQTKLVHRGNSSYPLHMTTEYNDEVLSTLDVRWDDNSLSGSLTLQGSVLSKLIEAPWFSVDQLSDLKEITLSGKLTSDFDADIASSTINARIVAPNGGIEHKQFSLNWTTPWEISLEATHDDWRASLTQPMHGYIERFGNIYEHIEWPSFVQPEQLPDRLNFALQMGSELNSENSFTGEAEFKTDNILLTLEQLLISNEEQEGRWSLQADSPSWLNLGADLELMGEGDFIHHDDWVINVRPKTAVHELQYANFQCQSITSEADGVIQLTLRGGELHELKGILNTNLKQCRQGTVYIDEWLTQLKMEDPEHAVLTFEWPSYLEGDVALNLTEQRLELGIEIQSEEASRLIQSLSPDLSGLVVNGTAKLEGQVFVDLQQLDDISGQWQGSFSGHGKYDDIRFDGTDLLLVGELNQQRIKVNPTSYIQFDNLDSGVPIRDLKGWISGHVSEEDVALLLTNVQGRLLEGSLSLDSIEFNPEPTGVSLLKLDNITLSSLAELQSQPGIVLQGMVSGRFPVEFDSSGVHIKEGKFYNVTPGFIRVKDNPQIQNLKQSSEQAAQALNLLENLDFETLNSSVDFTPAGDLILAVSIEGTNPDIDQAINFNYTHEENLYQLLQSLRLGDKLTEKVQQQYQERTQ